MDLRFTAGIDRNQFRSDIEAMRRDIMGLNNTVKSETSKMDGYFKNLSIGIAGYFSVNAVQGFVRELINVRGEFQKTEIAFTTMLGNGDQAKSLMNDMVNLAAKTPFSLQDVSSGAKQLLAFQVPANEVVDTLTRLGNIAAGLSVPLNRINLVYGQVKAKGKLMGDDLRQFTEAGIPMVAELAKKFNKTTAEISAMVSEGKIGFKDVKDVLFSMTNEGGMFYNLMEKQSKSLSGQISNLGDAWDQMLNKIGEANEGILSDGIQGLTFLVEHYQDVIQVIGTLVSAYGTYKAALIVTNTIQSAVKWAEMTNAALKFAQGISGLTKAQLLFNLAAEANPYVLIATGLAAVVAALVYFNTGSEKASELTKELNAQLALNKDISEAAAKEYNTSSGKKITAINKEIQVLKSEYSTLEMRKAAYNNLISINKSFTGTVDKEFRAVNSLNTVYSTLVKSLNEVAVAKGKAKVFEKLGEDLANAQLEKMMAGESLKKALATNKVTKQIIVSGGGQGYNTTTTEVTVNSNRKQIAEAKKQLDEASKNEADYNKKMKLLGEDRVKGAAIYRAQIRGGYEAGRKLSQEEINAKKEALKALEGTLTDEATLNAKEAKGWKEKIQDEIKSLDERIAKAPTKELAIELNKQKLDRQKLLDSAFGTTKSSTEQQISEIFPEGSIKELQQRIQLIREAIETAVNDQVKLRKLDKNGNDKDKNGNPFLTGETVSIAEASQRIEAINEKIKAIEYKGFQDRIAEAERQWENYYRTAEYYGKEIADAQYSELFKGSENYLAYLEKERKALEEKQKAGILSNEDKNNLIFLVQKINELNGTDTPLETFRKNIESSLNKIPMLSSKLSFLKDQLNSDAVKNGSPELKKFLKQQIDAVSEEQTRQYQEFLSAHQSFEEKKNAITEYYAELRKKIEADASLNNDQKINALRKAGQEEADAYSNAFMEELINNPNYRKAFADLTRQTTANLKILRNSLRQALSDKNLNPEALSRIRKDIEDLNNVISQRNPYTRLKDIIKELGDESLSTAEKMEKISEGADVVSQYINGVKGIVSDVTGALDDMGVQMDDATKDTIDNINQTLDGLGKMMDGAKDFAEGFATGDVFKMVTGAVKYVAGAIKAISAWTNGDKRKERQIKAWANAVNELKLQYGELEKQVSKALGEDKYKAQQNVISNLKEQKRLLEQMMQKEIDKKKTDKSKVDDYKNQINSINDQIDELQNNIIKNILQTDAQSAAAKLGDALVAAFGKGEDSAKAMRDVANDMFRDIVKNALNMKLEKAMQPILDDMLNAIGYDKEGKGSFIGLTEAQMEEFRKRIEEAGKFGQDFLNSFGSLFEGLDSTTNGLKGDIKGVSEKTAGALEAQINAIRIYQVEHLNLSKKNQQILIDSLRNLVMIEYNTRTLHSILKEISELNSKTSKPLAGLNG